MAINVNYQPNSLHYSRRRNRSTGSKTATSSSSIAEKEGAPSMQATPMVTELSLETASQTPMNQAPSSANSQSENQVPSSRFWDIPIAPGMYEIPFTKQIEFLLYEAIPEHPDSDPTLPLEEMREQRRERAAKQC